ncbi:MAG: hypothetical protein V9E94_19450 [Microthrixaceae bacterium]
MKSSARVSEETLRELMANGTLSEDDPVRASGGKWQAAGKALAIAPSFSASTTTAFASDVDLNAVDPDTAAEWYCQVLGQELGPLSFDELLRFAESGELRRTIKSGLVRPENGARVGSMGRLVAVMPYQNSSVTRVGEARGQTGCVSSHRISHSATRRTARDTASDVCPRGIGARVVRVDSRCGIWSQQPAATSAIHCDRTTRPHGFREVRHDRRGCPPATVAQMLGQMVIQAPAAPVAAAPTTPVAKPAAAAPIPTPTASTPAVSPKTEAPTRAESTPPVSKPAAVETPPVKVEKPPTPAPVTPAAEPVVKPVAAPVSTTAYSGASSASITKPAFTPPSPPRGQPSLPAEDCRSISPRSPP